MKPFLFNFARQPLTLLTQQCMPKLHPWHFDAVLQVLLWINQSFLLQDDIDADGSLNVAFMSLRGSGPLFLKMEAQGLVRHSEYLLTISISYMLLLYQTGRG